MFPRSEIGRPRSTTLSVKRDFKTGRTGRSAKQIESTRSSLAASGWFNWTSEAGHASHRSITVNLGGSRAIDRVTSQLRHSRRSRIQRVRSVTGFSRMTILRVCYGRSSSARDRRGPMRIVVKSRRSVVRTR